MSRVDGGLIACNKPSTQVTTKQTETTTDNTTGKAGAEISTKNMGVEGGGGKTTEKTVTTETKTVQTPASDCGKPDCRTSSTYDHRHAENDAKYGVPKGPDQK